MPGAFDPSQFDACVFDLDGTVWLGPRNPIPGAGEFVARCRADGARIAFATNAIVHTPNWLSVHLVNDGIALPHEPIVTSGTVIVRTLRAAGVRRVAAVVPVQLAELLAGSGLDLVSPLEHDAGSFGPVGSERALVLAASRDTTIGELERLGRLAGAGHRLYVSSRDPGFPVADGIEPGGGAVLAALTAMHDADVRVLGKPSAEYAAVVAETIGGHDQRIAVFGDSQRADMGIAHELGAVGVLLTRHSVRAVDASLPDPAYTAPTLADGLSPFAGRAIR